MKTKIVKRIGFYQLVVNDPIINQRYEANASSPIALAKIVHFFNSKHWSLQDIRYSKMIYPTPYLEGGFERMSADTEKEAQLFRDKLTRYNEKVTDNGILFSWHTNNRYILNGDNPPSDDEHITYQACWTFKEAYKRLIEAKDYWESQSNDIEIDDKKHIIFNPDIQPNSSDFFLDIIKTSK